MSDISSAQVLPMLVELKVQNGNIEHIDSKLAKLEEWVRNGRLSPNDLNQVKDQNELTALDIVRDKNPDLVQKWHEKSRIYSKI